MVPVDRLVLDCGENHKGIARPSHLSKAKDRLCYMNATHLSLNSGMPYVEGVAMSSDIGFPLHHAWCLGPNGEAIDVTWDKPERSLYRGVVIPRRALMRSIHKRGVYGCLDFGFGVNLRLIAQLRQAHSARRATNGEVK
jgi:hypothetical protein